MRSPGEAHNADGHSTYRRREWLADRLEAGLTVAQIADEADAAETTIRRWIRRHGLRTPGGADGDDAGGRP